MAEEAALVALRVYLHKPGPAEPVQVGHAKTGPLSSMNSVMIFAFINALWMNEVMIAKISHYLPLKLKYHQNAPASSIFFFFKIFRGRAPDLQTPPPFGYGLTTLKLLNNSLYRQPLEKPQDGINF